MRDHVQKFLLVKVQAKDLALVHRHRQHGVRAAIGYLVIQHFDMRAVHFVFSKYWLIPRSAAASMSAGAGNAVLSARSFDVLVKK
jgi:hypothetical protein